ncbi:MAG: N-acetyl-gamma-glutamyl-phosphate reductase [Ignavibacteriales bacterium]|nr:N-acetyl-gamma-glutamyl-phosphate reductase [Ignavibacteriales bacterium]
MFTVSILGASGYAGAELVRLLSSRPDVSISALGAHSAAGQRMDALYPALTGRIDLVLESLEEASAHHVDCAFVALPSGEGQKIVPLLLKNAKRVIDLGGDFRLQDTTLYEKYYKHAHHEKDLLREAVYGLPELNKSAIAAARLIANPGCYPTSIILGLLPALTGEIVEPEGIAIVSMSGISGAGRTSTVDFSFSELNDNIRAYKIGAHQHLPEIESVLTGASGRTVTVSFVPHLVPLTRGIYSTIHARLCGEMAAADILKRYRQFYREAPFVRMREQIPQLGAVANTNYCDIGLTVDVRTRQLIITSTIDNLLKGAAGQAVQNFNIMLGLPETTGLL